MKKNNTPLLLAILDGVALNPEHKQNAVWSAKTPVLDSLISTCPHTTLCSFGERVGLPKGQMGNSEVGHLTIGSGRVIEQDLSRINRTAANNLFPSIPAFAETISILKKENTALHLIGLTSTGGVHSELNHLISMIRGASELGAPKIVLHLITDGRDRPQKEALSELSILETEVSVLKELFPQTKIQIASMIGRFYAMDRDTRWERTEKAYRLFTEGLGAEVLSINSALEASYEKEIFDEFIDASIFKENIESTFTPIKDGDGVIFYNFRADRMKQIVSAFFREEWPHFERRNHPKLSALLTLTEYDESYPCQILFPPQEMKNSLGEVLSDNGYTQLRIAETEKYPHVTYFFNGGVDISFPGEERILVPSPRDVKTYDLKPEMSAFEITEKLITRLNEGTLDVIILNFANGDMVGHTGDLNATVKAVETVDTCLGRLLDEIKKFSGVALITADHGNADQMLDYETGEPHTYHTTHPVPFIIYNLSNASTVALKENGSLADIAPTILEILGLDKPEQMTGASLLELA